MENWIVSDFHYGHTNICGPKLSSWDKGYRDFDSLDQMNSCIVNSVNDLVDRKDTLYFLGDWSFGGQDNIVKLRERLNIDNIVFILGNHDHHIHKYSNLFNEIHSYLEKKINGKLFTLCHFALRVWNKSHHGSFHCYGHSHHSLPEIGRSMDVGWCKHRKPLNFDEVIKYLSKKDITFVDHHNKGTTE